MYVSLYAVNILVCACSSVWCTLDSWAWQCFSDFLC